MKHTDANGILLSFGFFVWSALNLGMIEEPGTFNPLAHDVLANIAVSLFFWGGTWFAYCVLRKGNHWIALIYGLLFFVGGAGFGLIIGATNKVMILIAYFQHVQFPL